MSFSRFVDERLAQAARVLDLGACARSILRGLIANELNPESVNTSDAYGRKGVLSWSYVFEQMQQLNHETPTINDAMDQLTRWSLVQVVGNHPSDPVVSGPAAIRITAHGRTCVGLAPINSPQGTVKQPNAPGWFILHSSNREGLLAAAANYLGPCAWSPLSIGTDASSAEWLAGLIAVQLCQENGVVLDATLATESKHGELLRRVLTLTRGVAGPRFLLVPTPRLVRTVGIRSTTDFLWVAPAGDDQRDQRGIAVDDFVSRMLLDRGNSSRMLADVSGVPGSSLVLPRRVSTQWSDLIAPESIQLQLKQIRMHVRFRLETLPKRSGLHRRGTGYALLLSGLPGTGKSMTAEALANWLDRPLVRLDLSAVLSKWLGETEQQIGQVFELAESSGSVLVLDEAEALFRQRQSGSQGGGNALNTAVAYLLTKFEEYTGVLVATTNRTQDLDDAFFRRFDDYLVMQMPDTDARNRLWLQMLPCGEPLDLDSLDLDFISKKFVISGGVIRGAAIRANAWAFGMNTALSMPILLAALGRELEKNDQASRGVLIKPWATEVAKLLNDQNFLQRN